MSLEKSRDPEDLDKNYRRNHIYHRVEALRQVRSAKVYLDNSLRGTQDRTTRSLISTAYELLRQAEDLVLLAGETELRESMLREQQHRQQVSREMKLTGVSHLDTRDPNVEVELIAGKPEDINWLVTNVGKNISLSQKEQNT